MAFNSLVSIAFNCELKLSSSGLTNNANRKGIVNTTSDLNSTFQICMFLAMVTVLGCQVQVHRLKF